jgi:hypothetical protein
MITNALKHGQPFRAVIAMNGLLDDLRKDIKKEFQRFKGKEQPAFIDETSREDFLQSLPKDLRRPLAPALLPWPELPHERGWNGMNQNSLFLAAAGGSLIVTDDDLFPIPAQRMGSTLSGLHISQEHGATTTTRVRDRQDALQGVESCELDLVQEYQNYLGASLTSLGIEGAPPQARVNLMSPGTYGDSGYSRARAFLSLKGKERKQAYGLGYANMRYGRELIRIPQGDTLSRSLHFLSMQSGHDLRVCPPHTWLSAAAATACMP